MPRPLPAVLALIVLGSCYSAPELGGPKHPRTSLAHVMAPDLSTSGFSARVHGMHSALALLSGEPQRLLRTASKPTLLVTTSVARLQRAPSTLAVLAGNEMARCPAPGALTVLSMHLPKPADLVRITGRVCTSPSPLSEIDDARHRTDPHDESPEASPWARIARRLRL